MARVVFTENLQRHVACPPCEVTGETVAAALNAAFRDNEKARGYVLDEHGAVRKHMVIFVDGLPVRDRTGLSDKVSERSQIWVMQALSGG